MEMEQPIDILLANEEKVSILGTHRATMSASPVFAIFSNMQQNISEANKNVMQVQHAIQQLGRTLWWIAVHVQTRWAWNKCNKYKKRIDCAKCAVWGAEVLRTLRFLNRENPLVGAQDEHGFGTHVLTKNLVEKIE